MTKNWLVVCWSVFVVVAAEPKQQSTLDIDPDVFKNISELITSKGYPVEEHQVTSRDGYTIGVQRIPYGRNWVTWYGAPGPAVLLHHGLFTSGVSFVNNFPNQSLGFVLADAGYDVWITNARGTLYSKKHTSIPVHDPAFWKFSWDEMALVDLPDTIDYILNVTGQEKLFYVGHSMGTTVILSLLSDRPEYNDKIRVAANLAPAALFGHTNAPWKVIVHFLNQTEFLLNILGRGQMFPNGFVQEALRVFVCEEDIEGCYNWARSLTGISTKQLNLTRVPVYIGSGVDASSVHTYLHYGQLIRDKKFQKYDFGAEQNMIKYNQMTPPEYALENITAPVALLWGLNDNVVSPVDVALLALRLKNLALNYQVPWPEWSHDDFAIGLDANTFVYQEILKLFSAYSD